MLTKKQVEIINCIYDKQNEIDECNRVINRCKNSIIGYKNNIEYYRAKYENIINEGDK